MHLSILREPEIQEVEGIPLGADRYLGRRDAHDRAVGLVQGVHILDALANQDMVFQDETGEFGVPWARDSSQV